MPIAPHELALLRGWIEQVPYPTLARLYVEGQDPLLARNRVELLRKRLVRKAELSHRLDLQIFWRNGYPESLCDAIDSQEGGRLIRWQQDAKKALEQLIALPEPVPDLDDPVVLWLSLRVARALVQAGFETLRAVHTVVIDQGASWWTAIPGVGPGSGRAVLQLFKSMGFEPRSKAISERRSLWEEVMQGMKFSRGELAFLDGSQGRNRERLRRCRLDVQDDIQAVEAWLSLYAHNEGTCRQYRREVKRFLLWCILVKRKAFSSVITQDCADYLVFIEAPDANCLSFGGTGKKEGKRELFRFEKETGLAPSTRKLVRTVLKSLCNWLVEQAYLESNPFSGLRRSNLHVKLRMRRCLTMEQWGWLLDYGRRRVVEVGSENNNKKYRRILFILCFAYETGLRLSELVSVRVGDIEMDKGANGEQQWWLKVVGKGGKTREVPISGMLISQLNEQLAYRAYSPIGVCNPEIPLIGRVRFKTGGSYEMSSYRDDSLSVSGLHYLLIRYFKEAAQVLADCDVNAAAHMAKATAHWLRHSYATHAVAAGVPLDVLRENLGHEDLATTSLYVRTARDRQYEETTRRHRVQWQ